MYLEKICILEKVATKMCAFFQWKLMSEPGTEDWKIDVVIHPLFKQLNLIPKTLKNCNYNQSSSYMKIHTC